MPKPNFTKHMALCFIFGVLLAAPTVTSIVWLAILGVPLGIFSLWVSSE